MKLASFYQCLDELKIVSPESSFKMEIEKKRIDTTVWNHILFLLSHRQNESYEVLITEEYPNPGKYGAE